MISEALFLFDDNNYEPQQEAHKDKRSLAKQAR